MTTRAVCPGSFDPVTAGHLDVIRRASALFDEVLVAVLHNPAKTGTFEVEQRMAFIAEATVDLGNIRVEAFARRLIVDVCRVVDATAIVKGLRSESDYAYEVPMAQMNRAQTGIETLFLHGDPALAHLSSSLIKEVCALGGDITGMVPEPVREALEARRT